MNKSVIIVGGGMSGLYIADALLDKGYNVIIFEKNTTLGGRVRTIELHNLGSIETGAGRFNERHHLLFKLIHKYALYHQVTPITNQQRQYHIGKYISHLTYKKYISKLFDNILLLQKKYTKSQLVSSTMKDILLLEYSPKIVDNIIGAFGYNSEFEIQNAYTTLNILQKEFNDKIQYFYLEGGLSQITHCLAQSIIKKGGTIYNNTEVTDYDPVHNMLYLNKTVKYTGDIYKVVFACTKKTLSSLSMLLAYDRKLFEFISTIEMAPLNRIFALFPLNKNGKVWFHDLPRLTTTLPIRYIIPLNPTSGLIQISYTDNNYAKYWQNKSKKELEHEIVNQLSIMFPTKKIPRPKWIKSYYWNEGVTYWKPFYKTYRNDTKNMYYIAGEIMSSKHSGWIEGALESAENVVRLFTTH